MAVSLGELGVLVMDREAWHAAIHGASVSVRVSHPRPESPVRLPSPSRLALSARVPLRGEGSCGGGGAPRDSAGSCVKARADGRGTLDEDD